MKRVCAWCGSSMGKADASVATESVITHGLCGGCIDNLFFQTGVALPQYLDSLGVPVLVLDDDAVIKAVNHKTAEILGVKLNSMKGLKAGNVFECEYSRLPEGCGRTIHCSGCTIRHTVTETYKTGKSFVKVPATLQPWREEGNGPVELLISTEKVGDAVLLRIDELT